MNDRDEWIKERAYALWEAAGRPHGQDHHHWNQALAEWQALEQEKPSSMAGARLINDFTGFAGTDAEGTASSRT